MSFWEDASPAVKTILVVGFLAVAYSTAAYFFHWWPNNAVQSDETGYLTHTRGPESNFVRPR